VAFLDNSHSVRYAKQLRRAREEAAETRFQIREKYRSWGYSSPDAFLKAKHGGKDLDEVVHEAYVDSLPAKVRPEDSELLRDLAGSVVDFYCGAKAGTSTKLPPLDAKWRKVMHTVCDDLQTIARRRRRGSRTLQHVSFDEGHEDGDKVMRLEVGEWK